MKIESVLARNPGPFTLDGTRTWIIEDAAVVDPGPLLEDHLEAVIAAAPRLSKIFVTHRHADHAPGAVELKRRTGAAVYAPDGALERSSIDVVLTDGINVGIATGQIEAIATPGHTREHFCFLTSDGELFTGDTVLGEGTTVIFPPDGNMSDYLESLRRLRARDPRRIFPGHGPVREDATAWIEYYIEHRLAREREIVAALERGPMNVRELRSVIYRDLAAPLHRAAELQLESHLAHLEEERRVERVGESYRLR